MGLYSESYECVCGYSAQSVAELESHCEYMILVVGDSFEDHH